VSRVDQASGPRTPFFETGDTRTSALAVIVARDGRLPTGADETVAEAGGVAVVVGSGAEQGARALTSAHQAFWGETGAGLRPASLAAALAPLLERVPLVVLPASPDGRDLAPRLAAAMDRDLIAQTIRVECGPLPAAETEQLSCQVRAVVSRLDDRVLVPVVVDGPAVATLTPGVRSVDSQRQGCAVDPLPELVRGSGGSGAGPADPEVLDVLEPDLRTMDLADATRVLAGGAGLAAGSDEPGAKALFDLLSRVAEAVGGSAGATRVATDAGWTGYERQIGTTGVAIDPDLYVAFGVSGAAQHIGGLGTPRHLVSVNTDPSSPMTAMADLGLVTDAGGLLVELGRRFGIRLPEENGDRS
jgi:electron transfer flavoprotein alpha subunit